ncbi:MAG TPA: TonB-dependent receptor [Hyphomicrobiaceae bacterium]|jgi:vitamin B12 transporter|nr:TonB-dependent receptor [Hyphomicrobiaceae bacterium]
MRLSAGYAAATAAGLSFLFPSPAGLAQTQLPAITVQGATLEAPRAAPGKGSPAEPAAQGTKEGDGVPLEKIGSAVTVVTGEQLRAQQIRNAADALRSLPGVAVSRSGGTGNLTQVRIRGAEAPHTLVLIDGIEANITADGEFDFSNLSADDLERIEIIRGPLSSLYGSNALGGVVNIVTRSGRGPLALTLKSEVGSLGTRDFAARFAGGSDKAHIAVSQQWRSTDGFNIAPLGDESDGSRLSSFALKGGVRPLPGVTLDFTTRYIDKTADRDAFGNPKAPDGTLATAFDDRSVLDNRIFLAGANLRWDMLEGKLTHELRATHNETITADRDATFGGLFKNVSEAEKAAYLATYRLDSPGLWAKHSFTGLIGTEAERFTSKSDFSGGAGERSQVAYAGEWRGEFWDRLFLTAGVRRDDNDNFQDFTTWRLAASLALREVGLRPHASVGTAVKLPTMFEQFGITAQFVPNPNLAPEESVGWDAGLELTLLKGRAFLDVTYFNADLTNKIFGSEVILPDPDDPDGQPKFTAVNLPGQSTRQGVEIAARFKLSPDLSLGAAYTYTDARDRDGLREVRRPPHAARADLGYAFANGRGTATLAVIYNGTTDDLGFKIPTFEQQRVLLDPYWVVNAAVSYKLQQGVEVFGRVENLFDQRYQEVFGFEAAPITAFAGIKLTFGGPDGVTGITGTSSK